MRTIFLISYRRKEKRQRAGEGEMGLLPGGTSPCTAFCCLCLRGSKGWDGLKAEAPFPLNRKEQARESLVCQSARSTANRVNSRDHHRLRAV